MTDRTCNVCGIRQDLAQFSKAKQYYMKKCKTCCKKKCEKCDNIAYNAKFCSECYRKAAGRVKVHRKVLPVISWLKACLNSTKRCSTARKARRYKLKENNITIEHLLELWNQQNGKCYLSNMDMRTEYNSIMSASIDRIDGSKGYLIGNVALACQWANMGRNRASVDEFKSILASFAKSVSS